MENFKKMKQFRNGKVGHGVDRVRTGVVSRGEARFSGRGTDGMAKIGSVWLCKARKGFRVKICGV